MVGHRTHRSRLSDGPLPRADELGALVVELAMVVLLLLTLFAGTYDYGMAWRTGLVANEAARTAARVGSARGSERDADFAALSGAKAALESSGALDKVERVVVFRSTTADGRMPSSCATGTGPTCQIITGDAFRTGWQDVADPAQATQANGCLLVATVRNWCPTTRNDVQATADHYGVWIELRHDFEFPLTGDGRDIHRTAVMRIEPRAQ